MITIWKFDLDVNDSVDVEMPQGAMLLAAGTQNPRDPSVIQVWAMIDDTEPTVAHRFLIAGTGHDLSGPEWPNARYLGTVLASNGALVWHVFDAGEVPS
jgi:hypothetical protein